MMREMRATHFMVREMKERAHIRPVGVGGMGHSSVCGLLWREAAACRRAQTEPDPVRWHGRRLWVAGALELLEGERACVALGDEHCRPGIVMPVVLATTVDRVAAVEAKHKATATDRRDRAVVEVEVAQRTKRFEMVIVLAVLAEPHRVRRLEAPAIHFQACALCLKEKCAPRTTSP